MKPAVLMLGWEFPPSINGGLGVACKGLGEAMSQYLNVSMMIPRAEGSLLHGGVEVMGIADEAPLLEKATLPAPTLKYGGVGKHLHHMEVARITANIRQYEPAAAILAPIAPARDFRRADKKAIDQLENPQRETPLYGAGMIGEIIRFGKQAAQNSLAKNFDIIHAHDWMTFWAGLEIRARSGKPLVLHIHSLEYDRAGEGHYRNDVFALEKFALEQADLVIAVSHYTAAILRTVYGIDAEKISVVHNGTERVIPYRKPKHFTERLVTFAGRITRQKGPARFLDMALRVLSQEDQVRFVMAGNGDLLPDMVEAVAMLGISDRFHFTGFLQQEALQDVYAMSDVFVMPSVSEPFGLSALEAASWGVPCVVAAQSGVREVMPSALVADSADPTAMAHAVLALLADPGHASSVAEQCRKEAASASWDHAAMEVIRTYEWLG